MSIQSIVTEEVRLVPSMFLLPAHKAAWSPCATSKGRVLKCAESWLARRDPSRCLIAAVLAICVTLAPSVRADSELDLDTLFEIERKDCTSVSPTQIIKCCSRELAKHGKLSPQQRCRVYLYRANAFRVLKNYRDAKRDAERALTLQPHSVEIRTLLGTILGGLGLYDRAIDELEAVIKLDPKYIRAYVTLAICFTEKGDQDAAVRYATKAIALDKNNGEGYYVRSFAYIRQGDMKALLSLDDLNKVIALGQFAETLYPTRPYVARARILLFLDKPEQARHDLLMARHLDAGAADVQGELWKACVISEKYHLANHVVEEAMGSGSKDRFLSVCRSLNRLIMGKFNKARDLAEKACAENPEYEFAYWARANVYFSLGDYEKALKDYDKGLLLYDGNVYLRASKAYLLACCPDVKYRDAKEAVGLALSVSRLANEQNPRWLMLVAMAWAQDGNYAEAARSAKTALDRARPDFPLRKEYERRLKLFEEKKPYRFKPGSKVFDYFGL